MNCIMLKGVHDPATMVSRRHEQVFEKKISVDNCVLIPKLSTTLCIDKLTFQETTGFLLWQQIQSCQKPIRGKEQTYQTFLL
jgi:hypothetical protein